MKKPSCALIADILWIMNAFIVTTIPIDGPEGWEPFDPADMMILFLFGVFAGMFFLAIDTHRSKPAKALLTLKCPFRVIKMPAFMPPIIWMASYCAIVFLTYWNGASIFYAAQLAVVLIISITAGISVINFSIHCVMTYYEVSETNEPDDTGSKKSQ